ncbi:elongation factor G [Paenibacillus sp. GM2]|uniref:elongation factor G n=1 Tax=Paenibacillus sp. GM2 TaxID=1622070 RepID=UPI0008385C27|nr:TetM/TetW/TetO/TetS family tetracycline resistance ribosomal protection protein [Paenibacillus sp. GM2]
MKTINIGVLAHVDAGKTTLTERILLETGIINAVGSVDKGNTITDSLELERKRGITIKASAVSFWVGDVKINLIDTPGHADFISEVEHSLSILDGVILVISAVEGVQSQTKVLMNTLTDLGIPSMLFINKMDRLGANYSKVIEEIKLSLTDAVIELTQISNEGCPDVAIADRQIDIDVWIERLSAHNERLLSNYIENVTVQDSELFTELCVQTQGARIFPVLAGSAALGIGVDRILQYLRQFFPVNLHHEEHEEGPLSAIVFKVEKSITGERLAYIRVYEGFLAIRSEVDIIRTDAEEKFSFKIKKLETLELGGRTSVSCVYSGDIAVLFGSDLRIGDILGQRSDRIKVIAFQEPPIRIQIAARQIEDTHRLHEALEDLTAEDPFIQYAQNAVTREMSIKIFGDIQKEVIEETLKSEFGIEANFSNPEVICIERPVSTGSSVEFIGEAGNPFYATIGFRIEPGAAGTGLQYRREVELGSLPLPFQRSIKDTVEDTLREGLHGWEVRDLVVTLTHTGYSSPVTTAGDFRNLVPLVLMKALDEASTLVYEPYHNYFLRIPESSLNKALYHLTRLQATFSDPIPEPNGYSLQGALPVRNTDSLKQMLYSFTGGEGFLSTKPGEYYPIEGAPPEKSRSRPNPLNRKAYLLHIHRIIQ